jgi:hypothetical protein
VVMNGLFKSEVERNISLYKVCIDGPAVVGPFGNMSVFWVTLS